MFNRILAELEAQSGETDNLMIDATHLKAHRTAASVLKKALPRCIGRSQGGLTTKPQVVCDGKRRPLMLHLAEGQANDYKTAAAVFEGLPRANALLAEPIASYPSDKRMDRYGGSVENRARFLLEIVDTLIDVWGADRVACICVREGRNTTWATATQGHLWLCGPRVIKR